MKNTLAIIKKNTYKVISTLIALIILATLPLTVSAHALKETNARVTLRDGQVEIRLWVDMDRWQKKLQDNQAWLLGDIEQVMPVGLTANETTAFIENILSKDISLTLNSQEIAFSVAAISPVTKVTNHHEYTELVLSSTHAIAQVKTLDIRFPKSLGAVHTSIVKPKYKILAAGTNARVLFSE